MTDPQKTPILNRQALLTIAVAMLFCLAAYLVFSRIQSDVDQLGTQLSKLQQENDGLAEKLKELARQIKSQVIRTYSEEENRRVVIDGNLVIKGSLVLTAPGNERLRVAELGHEVNNHKTVFTLYSHGAAGGKPRAKIQFDGSASNLDFLAPQREGASKQYFGFDAKHMNP